MHEVGGRLTAENWHPAIYGSQAGRAEWKRLMAAAVELAAEFDRQLPPALNGKELLFYFQEDGTGRIGEL